MSSHFYQLDPTTGEFTLGVIRNTSKVKADDVLKYLKEHEAGGDAVTSTPPLPRGTRFFFRHERVSYFVVEMKPGIHEVTYDVPEDNAEEYGIDPDSGTVKVAMPWQYFVLSFHEARANNLGITWSFNGVQLFWARERMESLSESLIYHAQLPNVDEYSSICLGSTVPNSGLPIDIRIENLVENFYSPASVFNAELGWRVPYGDIDMWEHRSKQSSLIWRDLGSGQQSLLAYLGVDLGNIDRPNRPRTLAQTLDEAAAAYGEAVW